MSSAAISAARGLRFSGGSEMQRRVSSLDWSKTPVGAVESWPQSLTSTVKLLLASRYPMVLIWGPAFTQFYNDAYSELIGDRHPAALGIDIRVTLAEGWDTLGPMIEKVMREGVANWTPALPLEMRRAGYREEAYFSVSHAPAEDDAGNVAGMLAVCSEVTEQVLGERRTRLLRELALKASATQSVEATCGTIATTVSSHALDVPFASIYLRSDREGVLRLGASTGIEPGSPACPLQVEWREGNHAWPFERAMLGEIVLVPDAGRHLRIDGGFFATPVRTALAIPIASSDPASPDGVLIVGVSPSRALDESYRSFYELLATQVSLAIRNARAHEDARKRAEKLAELDRAKTEFFSNVSHEFRTPLTLMLGPLEDALSDSEEPRSPRQRERLELVRRNAQRLLKLVNTLLDFSRIEAGRADATYEPVDLSALTADLASLFRSAVERAGLTLTVDAPPLPEPVFVDREMWEKIVLNLLSNALKHTPRGGITVRLRAEKQRVILTVRDTGTGIPEDELPRLFQRFHRVHGAESRSHEGSGIGLALVHELTKLHGGVVTVESVVGRGSTFSVALPTGSAHLPAQHVRGQASDPTPSATAPAFIDEASRWLPPDEDASAARHARTANAPQILVVDDNADLRTYMVGLLSDSFRVTSAADGLSALRRAREQQPDLILSDVMMPGLDGSGLLRELRADVRTRAIPVIFLSARAGEGATVEGLEAGADDYLVKPFAARELLARVRARLEIDAMRRRSVEQAQMLAALEAQQRWTEMLLDTMPLPLLLLEPGSGRITFANRAARDMAGGTFRLGTPARVYDTVYDLTDERDRPLSNAETPAARAARGEDVRAARAVWHTPAGRFSLLVDSRLLPEAHGHPATVALAIRDVSELVQIQTELENAVRVRDEFLAIASHELGTPLTPMGIQLHTLARQAGAVARDEESRIWLEKRTERLRRQWERLRRLVTQLIDVSRPPTEGMSLELEPVDLVNVVKAMVDDVHERRDGLNGCDLRVAGDASVVGHWDRFALEQVVKNLVDNARKFGRGRPVLISVTVDGGMATLTVKDEGIGIAPENRARIFGRFERGVSARHYGGLGFGLYLVRRLAHALGGSITVESELDAGSTFTLLLPLQGPVAPGQTAR